MWDSEMSYERIGGGMNKKNMISFRTDDTSLRKLNILCLSRHRSRGQILREAVDMYFRVHQPFVDENMRDNI